MSLRFYIDGPLGPGPVILEGPEAHHLLVSRMRPGERVLLFNGDGHEYCARIDRLERRRVHVVVDSRQTSERELACRVDVAVPLPKGDRAQFLVEKLTELGVTTFVPLKCQRSLIDPGENRLEKLQRYVIEASKQCGRNVLMAVAAPVDWASYSRSGKEFELSLVAHPRCDSSLSPHWLHPAQIPRAVSYRLAVGPEGGFTDEEIGSALDAGWRLVDLGPRILRVETAALALTAELSLRGSAGGRST